MTSTLKRTASLFILLIASQPSSGKEVPFLSSRVNDYANILSPAAIQRLEQELKTHEDSTSNQIVVLTVGSLEGEVLEEFSMKVVEKWKLGTEKNDNGVLLLIANDERQVRIEVGDGLEGVLPDGICGTIIRQQIVPYFKEQRFDDGVEAGVAAIFKAIGNEYVAEPESDEFIEAPPLAFGLAFFAFFLFVVGMFTVTALFSKGFGAWFMYVFLIPFWLLFPMASFGTTAGFAIFAVYAVGFVVARILFARSKGGKQVFDRWGKKFASSGFATGGSSSGRSWSSSSSFSGGGGSFSGGGASGSW